MKLGINIIPRSSWYNNVRSKFSKSEWDVLRRACYKKASRVCEICKGNGLKQGFKWPVECHEIWEFDDKKHIQKLIRLIALCPLCHKCQHPGLAEIHGDLGKVKKHFGKVNKLSKLEVEEEFSKEFVVWRKRSEYKWELDISVLKPIQTGEPHNGYGTFG